MHLTRTRVNEDKRKARNYILGPFEGSRVLSARSTRNQPDERGHTYVRQPNLQGGDRLLRCGWRYRVAWHLLLDRDGRVAISAVCLALIFFAMFIVGSYWWMVFGPGRGL